MTLTTNFAIEKGIEIVKCLSSKESEKFLSYTDIKKRLKLTDTALSYCLKLLLKEQIVEKKLIDGKIKYASLPLTNSFLKITLFTNPEFYKDDQLALSTFLFTLLRLHTYIFFENELSKAFYPTLAPPTYNFIFGCLNNQISRFLKYIIQNKNIKIPQLTDAMLQHFITPYLDTLSDISQVEDQADRQSIPISTEPPHIKPFYYTGMDEDIQQIMKSLNTETPLKLEPYVQTYRKYSVKHKKIA